MAANLQFLFHSGSFGPSFPFSSPTLISRFRPVSVSFNSIFAPIFRFDAFTLRFGTKIRRERCRVAAAMLLPDNPVVSDICATAVSGGVALSLLRLWTETAKRGLDQKLNRKLVHTSIGLAFMLCWPMFSSGHRGALLASLIPGVNIIRMLVLGLGILKDEATVKSMSRNGDCRELLKGPLYYVATITLVCIFYWRTSPISIALICNLCAGDGLADIVGRRFGSRKISYNKNKSLAGSVAMVSAGFLASVGYMYYFSSFGYVEGSNRMVLGFLVVSIASALVESLPISTEIDDNLTVPLTSLLVGSLVF
ncbi:farnesol kinase, chloroplastic [Cucurbita maxima]|uniref:Farnesol kinase, chloroplastic n=1 Tax=Cucurbita maxima TaxID=3661 RepID=A0A6J1I3Z6_CUCMA|nr:farnesol kinase, chloroplastic [Cucurbita maxima]